MAGAQNVMEKSTVITRPLNISAFLPDELSLFRYYGSLTTPACFEVVHWNVSVVFFLITARKIFAPRNKVAT